ncbi:hypothetical protein KUL106_18720 [Alteromonas sp. KUL106]|nr:hypothetical protein KUL106_18720 [Alteromonas sp. KUL106]
MRYRFIYKSLIWVFKYNLSAMLMTTSQKLGERAPSLLHLPIACYLVVRKSQIYFL